MYVYDFIFQIVECMTLFEKGVESYFLRTYHYTWPFFISSTTEAPYLRILWPLVQVSYRPLSSSLWRGNQTYFVVEKTLVLFRFKDHWIIFLLRILNILLLYLIQYYTIESSPCTNNEMLYQRTFLSTPAIWLYLFVQVRKGHQLIFTKEIIRFIGAFTTKEVTKFQSFRSLTNRFRSSQRVCVLLSGLPPFIKSLVV